ncbi:hypothetical protein HDE68_000537 [Pedobacter cryoconitis]|uniref:Uncharacterized protein n=1 Tax=Pedobacter cryoconitis TaxID=188932 RepID=A0A7W8ZIQ8_9SPHI|nr:hypothetical protein [Pedobacter cryoconitis]
MRLRYFGSILLALFLVRSIASAQVPQDTSLIAYTGQN